MKISIYNLKWHTQPYEMLSILCFCINFSVFKKYGSFYFKSTTQKLVHYVCRQLKTYSLLFLASHSKHIFCLRCTSSLSPTKPYPSAIFSQAIRPKFEEGWTSNMWTLWGETRTFVHLSAPSTHDYSSRTVLLNPNPGIIIHVAGSVLNLEYASLLQIFHLF